MKKVFANLKRFIKFLKMVEEQRMICMQKSGWGKF
jgi:hypothetical protein